MFDTYREEKGNKEEEDIVSPTNLASALMGIK